MGALIDKLTNWSGGPDACMPMYGHQISDLAVFVANLFMLAYAAEATVRGYEDSESCEYPLLQWLLAQSIMIFVLQIFTPLLLVVPKVPNLLAPIIAGTLFLAQWILLFMGWYWTLSPSSCSSTAPFTWNGAYWILVVYSIAIPLETYWYGTVYMAFMQREKGPLEYGGQPPLTVVTSLA